MRRDIRNIENFTSSKSTKMTLKELYFGGSDPLLEMRLDEGVLDKITGFFSKNISKMNRVDLEKYVADKLILPRIKKIKNEAEKLKVKNINDDLKKIDDYLLNFSKSKLFKYVDEENKGFKIPSVELPGIASTMLYMSLDVDGGINSLDDVVEALNSVFESTSPKGVDITVFQRIKGILNTQIFDAVSAIREEGIPTAGAHLAAQERWKLDLAESKKNKYYIIVLLEYVLGEKNAIIGKRPRNERKVSWDDVWEVKKGKSQIPGAPSHDEYLAAIEKNLSEIIKFPPEMGMEAYREHIRELTKKTENVKKESFSISRSSQGTLIVERWQRLAGIKG